MHEDQAKSGWLSVMVLETVAPPGPRAVDSATSGSRMPTWWPAGRIPSGCTPSPRPPPPPCGRDGGCFLFRLPRVHRRRKQIRGRLAQEEDDDDEDEDDDKDDEDDDYDDKDDDYEDDEGADEEDLGAAEKRRRSTPRAGGGEDRARDCGRRAVRRPNPERRPWAANQERGLRNA